VILEIADIRIPAGQNAAFEEAIQRGIATVASRAQGFKGDGPIPPIPDEVRIEAAARYIQACDTIRGEAFVPNTEAPQARMRKNLGL